MGITCPHCRLENSSDSKYCKECATALPSAPNAPSPPTRTIMSPREELTTGSLFAGRYQIVEELGGGGMGKVYRTLDTKVGEEIALKLIKPEIAADAATVERFKNELKIARKIVHKSVGRVYDLNESHGTHFITMEYVRGEDLKAFIRSSGQMAVGTSLRIARQVAEGLAEAHALGVVHRDLKPSNIMIDRDGNGRIMDFGIARLTGTRGVTGGNVLIGTPEYMSPEQLEGKEAGPASDIYALGIVVFEMLTGRLPFEGETPLSVAIKQKTEAPPDPRALNPQIPEDLKRIILKCLEKSKEKRYPSAAVLLADLAKVEQSLPTTSHPLPVPKAMTSKQITVRLPSKKIWIPAAALLLALLAFAVWQIIPEADSARRTIAVVGFQNQSGDAGLDYLREAIPNLLITSLGESKRLRVTSWARMKDFLRNAGRDAAAIFDEEAGFEACRKEGIEAIVLGSFVKAGETFATDAKVLDVSTKSLLRSASAKGSGIDSILKSQIDEISRAIRRGIALPPLKIETPARKIIDLTTSSMEAYNNYLKSQEAYDHFFWADARKYAEKAVEIDPTFALAYSLLSQAATSLLDYPARDAALEKAKTHAAKATERERLFIEARFASTIEHNPEERFRLLNELVGKYPDDKQGHYELGQYFYNRNDFEAAAAEYGKSVALDPKFAPAFNMIGYSRARLGDFAKALQAFERYAELNPGLPNPVDSIAEMHLFQGDLDAAAAKYREALALKPDFYASCSGLSYVYALKEDYAESEHWRDEFVKRAPLPQAKMEGLYQKCYYDYFLGRNDRALAASLALKSQAEQFKFAYGVGALNWLMGFLYTDKGEFDKARKAFEDATEILDQDDPASRTFNAAVKASSLGWVEIQGGRINAAKAHLGELENLLPGLAPEERRMLLSAPLLLGAEIALAENNVEQAIGLGQRIDFGRLPSVNTPDMAKYNMPFVKDVLARAYGKKGALDKAVAEYERLTRIDPKISTCMLISPLYRYRLGRVLEQKGDRGRARLEYEKFLKYWANADPSHPELKDARARLAGLR